MPSLLNIRSVARIAAGLTLAASVAGCILPWPPFGASTETATTAPWPTAEAWPMPSATPAATATRVPLSLVEAFEARIAASDFQAQGPVSGSIGVKLFFGSTSGSISGSFRVSGADSSFSITSNVLGMTDTNDNVVVGGRSYSRSNGGQWTEGPASGKTLQGFVNSGVLLVDWGVEYKSGRLLHRISVADLTGVGLDTFGIAVGSGLENVTVTALSFWALDDGTPAGMTIEASLDQKVFGTPTHETVTLDIAIDSLSGVWIAAPTN